MQQTVKTRETGTDNIEELYRRARKAFEEAFAAFKAEAPRIEKTREYVLQAGRPPIKWAPLDEIAALALCPDITAGTASLHIDIATGTLMTDGRPALVLSMEETARRAILDGDMPLDRAIRRAETSRRKIDAYLGGQAWAPKDILAVSGDHS